MYKAKNPPDYAYHTPAGMSLEKQSVTMRRITLGLSIHRPEMIPFIVDGMNQHDAIFLEEPPVANFNQMLRGAFSVDDYLMDLDVEYPEFSKALCCVLRKLHAQGKKIFQV